MRVAAIANRIRMAQIDLADESAEIRREHLREEIGRALQGVSPAERDEFLRELRERFPVWSGEAAPVAAAPSGGAAPAATDKAAAAMKAELEDPWALAARLKKLASRFDEATKQRMADELAEAGISHVVTTGGGGLGDSERELKAKLGMAATQNVNPQRVAEMATLLIDFVNSMDQFGWAAWQRVNKDSTLRKSSQLLPTLAKFSAADKAVGRPEVGKSLDPLRKVILALIAASNRVGNRYAQRHLQKYAPPSIEASAKGGLMGRSAGDCWKRYVELMAGVDEVSLEQEITQVLAEEAERLVGGR